jgi:hypothetical protein
LPLSHCFWLLFCRNSENQFRYFHLMGFMQGVPSLESTSKQSMLFSQFALATCSKKEVCSLKVVLLSESELKSGAAKYMEDIFLTLCSVFSLSELSAQPVLCMCVHTHACRYLN